MIRVYLKDDVRLEVGPDARYSPAPGLDFGVGDVEKIILFQASIEIDEGHLPNGDEIKVWRAIDPTTGLTFEVPLVPEAAQQLSQALIGSSIVVPQKPQIILPGHQ